MKAWAEVDDILGPPRNTDGTVGRPVHLPASGRKSLEAEDLGTLD